MNAKIKIYSIYKFPDRGYCIMRLTSLSQDGVVRREGVSGHITTLKEARQELKRFNKRGTQSVKGMR